MSLFLSVRLLCTISQEPYIIGLSFMVNIPEQQKILSVALHISRAIHIIWLSFMVQMCKMICPGVFFFQFFSFSGWKGSKWPKMTKISVCGTLYFRSHVSYLHLWYTCMYKNIISPAIFFIFFKILIFGIIRGNGKRAKNGPKWQKILCLASYFRNHTSYDCDLGTHV